MSLGILSRKAESANSGYHGRKARGMPIAVRTGSIHGPKASYSRRSSGSASARQSAMGARRCAGPWVPPGCLIEG